MLFYTIFIRKFLLIILVTVFTNHSLLYSQDSSAGGGAGGDNLIENSMQDLSIVAGTSIAGAVLGLSTLSFVKIPKAHMRNILVGGSIGIIIGVAIIAYTQATKSHERIFKGGKGDQNNKTAYIYENKVRESMNEWEEKQNNFMPTIQLRLLTFN